MTPNRPTDDPESLLARERLARLDAQAASRAKDALLAMLAHELRNPLNALVTSAEVLRCAPPGTRVADKARGVVARQTLELATLIDRVTDLSRVLAADLAVSIETVDLQATLRRSVANAAARAHARGPAPDLDAPVAVLARADPGRIEQVMALLIDNATRHTPPGTAVTVALRRVGGDAVVTVTDSGPGIDTALLPRLFEPFAHGVRALGRGAGGPGLGLALVKRLIELHGGSVQARSSSAGSTFEWRVPAAPD